MKNTHGFTIGQSKIPGAGTGLFAARHIKQGEPLFIAFFRSTEADNVQHSKPRRFEMEYTQAYPNNFVNHSDTPNTKNEWCGSFWIIKKALRDIREGEEITSSYDHGMKIICQEGFEMDNWKCF